MAYKMRDYKRFRFIINSHSKEYYMQEITSKPYKVHIVLLGQKSYNLESFYSNNN